MEYKTADYHVHSTISPDAKGTMEEMCNAAIAAGIEEIAFTDHYEFYAGGITGKYFNREYLIRTASPGPGEGIRHYKELAL